MIKSECGRHGCEYHPADMKIHHALSCPYHSGAAEKKPQPAGDEHRFNTPGLAAQCQACGLTKEFAPPKCDNRLYAADVKMLQDIGVFPKPADNVKSLALARADKGSKPQEHPALAALDMARDWVRENNRTPSHIIVFLARANEDGSDGIKFFQSGDYRSHAQTGMVIEGLDMMRNTGTYFEGD